VRPDGGALHPLRRRDSLNCASHVVAAVSLMVFPLQQDARMSVGFRQIAVAAIAVAWATAAFGAPVAGAAPRKPTRYLHSLTSMTGPLTTSGASIALDPRSKELLVVANGLVHVFNPSGVLVHRFGQDDELRRIRAVAPLDVESGDYAVLADGTSGPEIARCDYRGTRLGTIALANVPEAVGPFTPDSIAFVGGRLYLGDEAHRRVVVTDLAGRFERWFDLDGAIGTGTEKGFAEPSVRGLQVDRRGNILFVVPPLFRAFVVAPDGSVRSFGTKGDTPGRFNVVVAITSDELGRFYVVDVLRCAVSVWDPELRFVEQFGFRGFGPGGLVTPGSIIAGDGKVFVSQGRDRGVSVFQAGEG
jgi:hypothetical protein